ncbi:MAG: HAD family phosphatase [Breznakibacter sp.]
MIKAVFFDMDGVLYDSMGHHAHSWSKAFAEAGIRYSEADAYQNEGRTSTGTIQLMYQKHYGRPATPEEVENIYNRKSQLVNEMPKARILPGIQDFINTIRTGGIDIYVVTGSKQPSLLDRLEHDFGVCPSKVVSGKDVTREKPHPEPYLRALEKSGLQPHGAMVVENAPLGVQSAKSARLFTVAVNTGPLPDGTLKDSGADIVLQGTNALQPNWKLIRSLFSAHWHLS